jgi:hypothetical protein
MKDGVYISKDEEIMKIMGIKTENTENFRKKKYVNIITKGIKDIEVRGFDRMLVFESSGIIDTLKNKDSVNVIRPGFDFSKSEMYLAEGKDTLRIQIKEFADSLGTATPEASKMTVEKTFNNYFFRIIFTNISLDRNDKDVRVSNMKAYILQRRELVRPD